MQAPPSSASPPGSVSLDKAIETQFSKTSSDNLTYKVHCWELRMLFCDLEILYSK